MEPFGRKIILIFWEKGISIFLEEPFIETSIIDYMLFEDKLKDLLAKVFLDETQMKDRIKILLTDQPHNSAAGGNTTLSLYLMGEALSS